jgi:hypothetical protein
MAQELHEGEQAYLEWPDRIEHIRVNHFSYLAKELRASFPFKSLDQWYTNFEFSLSDLSTDNEFAKRLKYIYDQMISSHNHNNWNKLRLPFIWSILHQGRSELRFNPEEWAEYAGLEKETVIIQVEAYREMVKAKWIKTIPIRKSSIRERVNDI